MNIDDYRGKKCVLKSTDEEGTIKDVIPRRGAMSIAYRFLVDINGTLYELMPHEVKIKPE